MSEASRACRCWAWIAARFSFKGRASRMEFWLTLPCAFLCVALGAALTVAVYLLLAPVFAHRLDVLILAVILPMAVLDFILYIWLGTAVSIRRTHDLGYSYREAFGFRVNMQGGFKRGTIGPNEYGPDPLTKAALPE